MKKKLFFFKSKEFNVDIFFKTKKCCYSVVLLLRIIVLVQYIV